MRRTLFLPLLTGFVFFLWLSAAYASLLFTDDFSYSTGQGMLGNGWKAAGKVDEFNAWGYTLYESSDDTMVASQANQIITKDCGFAIKTDIKPVEILGKLGYSASGITLTPKSYPNSKPAILVSIEITSTGKIRSTVRIGVIKNGLNGMSIIAKTDEFPKPEDRHWYKLTVKRLRGANKLHVDVSGDWNASYDTPDIPDLDEYPVAGIHAAYGKNQFDNFRIENDQTEKPCPDNLIQNNSFENSITGWQLDSHCKIDSIVAHSGKSSLMMHSDDPSKPVLAYQDFAAQPGKRYLVRAWMKAGGIQGAWWASATYTVGWAGTKGFDYNDPVNGFISGVKPSGVRDLDDWTPITYLTPPAPSNAKLGRITLLIDWELTGTVWADDISVSEVNAGFAPKWEVKPASVVCSTKNPPFTIRLLSADLQALREPVDLEFALCAPTWNKHIQTQRFMLKPEMTIAFPTDKLNYGMWRISLTPRSRITGKALMETEIKNVYKRPPIECFLNPHTGILVEGEGWPAIDVRPYVNGTLRTLIYDAKGRLLRKSSPITVKPTGDRTLRFSGAPPLPGKYKAVVNISLSKSNVFSTELYFTIISARQARKGVVVGRDNVLFDKGKPWFPMFMLTNTTIESGPFHDGLKETGKRNPIREQEVYDFLTGTPFGVIDWGMPVGGLEETKRFADELQKRGIRFGLCLRDIYPSELGGWAGFDSRGKFFPGKSRDQVARSLIREFKGYPALAFYYINDEMGTEYIKYLQEMRKWSHEEDPLHPCVSSHYDFDPIRELASGTDIVAPEFYAWRSFDEPSQIGAWADKVNSGRPKGMPMWANIIWIGNSYTLSDARLKASAYMGIAKGCKGIIMDGISRVASSEDSKNKWATVVDWANELQKHAPILLQPISEHPCMTKTPDIFTRTLSGPHGNWLLVVNGCRWKKTANIAVPENYRSLLENDRMFPVKHGCIELTMQPYEVRLLQLR